VPWVDRRAGPPYSVVADLPGDHKEAEEPSFRVAVSVQPSVLATFDAADQPTKLPC
jgi:hypothetical protein